MTTISDQDELHGMIGDPLGRWDIKYNKAAYVTESYRLWQSSLLDHGLSSILHV